MKKKTKSYHIEFMSELIMVLDKKPTSEDIERYLVDTCKLEFPETILILKNEEIK